MKIEYVRSLRSSSMHIMLDRELQRTEEEMLSRNQIEGLLPIVWQKEDGGYKLRYDITGKQALDTVLEGYMADENFLISLIQEICLLYRRLEKFLLIPEGVLLNSEMIYWDYKIEKFFFCYYPCSEENLQSQLTHLVEYLLTKTDHKNVRAVEIAYGLYEVLMQPAYSISEIQKKIDILRKDWQEEAAQAATKGSKEESVNVMETDEKMIIKEKPEVAWRKVIEEKKTIVKKWMEAWIKTCIIKHKKVKKEQEIYVFEPEEEPEKQTLPTVLLSDTSEEIQGILRYEGRMGLPNLHITKLPFLIGSGKECDGVIDDVTVSRKHALITKQDDVYFIEDLNSSNGTIVADGLLNYKTRISLRKNESIVISNQPYRLI